MSSSSTNSPSFSTIQNVNALFDQIKELDTIDSLDPRKLRPIPILPDISALLMNVRPSYEPINPITDEYSTLRNGDIYTKKDALKKRVTQQIHALETEIEPYIFDPHLLDEAQIARFKELFKPLLHGLIFLSAGDNYSTVFMVEFAIVYEPATATFLRENLPGLDFFILAPADEVQLFFHRMENGTSMVKKLKELFDRYQSISSLHETRNYADLLRLFNAFSEKLEMMRILHWTGFLIRQLNRVEKLAVEIEAAVQKRSDLMKKVRDCIAAASNLTQAELEQVSDSVLIQRLEGIAASPSSQSSSTESPAALGEQYKTGEAELQMLMDEYKKFFSSNKSSDSSKSACSRAILRLRHEIPQKHIRDLDEHLKVIPEDVYAYGKNSKLLKQADKNCISTYKNELRARPEVQAAMAMKAQKKTKLSFAAEWEECFFEKTAVVPPYFLAELSLVELAKQSVNFYLNDSAIVEIFRKEIHILFNTYKLPSDKVAKATNFIAEQLGHFLSTASLEMLKKPTDCSNALIARIKKVQQTIESIDLKTFRLCYQTYLDAPEYPHLFALFKTGTWQPPSLKKTVTLTNLPPETLVAACEIIVQLLTFPAMETLLKNYAAACKDDVESSELIGVKIPAQFPVMKKKSETPPASPAVSIAHSATASTSTSATNSAPPTFNVWDIPDPEEVGTIPPINWSRSPKGSTFNYSHDDDE